jgi:hypothetical protein
VCNYLFYIYNFYLLYIDCLCKICAIKGVFMFPANCDFGFSTPFIRSTIDSIISPRAFAGVAKDLLSPRLMNGVAKSAGVFAAVCRGAANLAFSSTRPSAPVAPRTVSSRLWSVAPYVGAGALGWYGENVLGFLGKIFD